LRTYEWGSEDQEEVAMDMKNREGGKRKREREREGGRERKGRRNKQAHVS
jgi:hypothetical protein